MSEDTTREDLKTTGAASASAWSPTKFILTNRTVIADCFMLSSSLVFWLHDALAHCGSENIDSELSQPLAADRQGTQRGNLVSWGKR